MHLENLSNDEMKQEALRGLEVRDDEIVMNDFHEDLYRVKFHLYLRRAEAMSNQDAKEINEIELLMDVLSLRFSIYKLDNIKPTDESHRIRLFYLRDNYKENLINKMSEL